MGLYAGGSAIETDGSGNIYVTGSENNNSTWNSFCTIKYNSAGQRLWTANYYGINQQGGRGAVCIALDNSLNVYVGGGSVELANKSDCCVIKYDVSGNQIWARYYDGPAQADDYIQKIKTDAAGNIYAAGISSAGGYNFRVLLIKYSGDGRELWTRIYGTADVSTYANGLVIDDNCNIYITGSNNYSAYVIKFDSAGTQQWANTYRSNITGTQANDIFLDDARNSYVTGYSFSQNPQGQHVDIFTNKYGPAGNLLWARRYNPDSLTGNSRYVGNSVTGVNSGSIFVSGFYEPDQFTARKLCLLKYSAAGEPLWSINDTVQLSSEQTYMAKDSGGNIYVAAGLRDTVVSSFRNTVVLKYGGDGNKLNLLRYTDPLVLSSSPAALKITSSNGIIYTGWATKRDYAQRDFLTVKYSQPIGISPVGTEIPKSYSLSQNYPNPFNPRTKIRFGLPKTEKVKIVVYDITARQVTVLLEQELKSGMYAVDFDGNSLSSGIYFYTLLGVQYSKTLKMILIK